MQNVQNVEQVFVGKSPVALTTGVATTPQTINDGEIALFTPAGERILGANASGQKVFRIASKLDGKVFISDNIETNNITMLTQRFGAPAVEQVDYIGFNGTTGDIDEIDDNIYSVTVYVEEFYQAIKDNKYTKRFNVITGANADKHDIAEELCRSGILNVGLLTRDPEPIMKTELVSAAGGSNLGTGVGNITLEKGSRFFTADNISDTTGGGEAIAVGSFLKIGSAADSPLYKIVFVDAANNIGQFDTIYQGENVTAPDTAFRIVTSGDFLGAAVGVKMTGYVKPFDFSRVGRLRYSQNIWNIGMADFGNTLYTQNGHQRGINIPELVAESEYFHQSFEFGDNKYEIDNGRPVLFSNRQYTSGAFPFYHAIILRFEFKLWGAWKEDISPKQVTIFTPGGAGTDNDPDYMSTATNGFRAVLAAITGTALANPA